MAIAEILGDLGVTLLVIVGVGLLFWIVRLLTRVTAAQNEQLKILQRAYEEREKTREREIEFLKTQNSQSKELFRQEKAAMLSRFETEKLAIEGRLATTLRTTAVQRLALGTSDASVPAVGLSSGERLTSEELRVLSLLFSHNMRASMTLLIQALREPGPGEGLTNEHSRRVLVAFDNIDTLSHTWERFVDPALENVQGFDLTLVLKEKIARYSERLSFEIVKGGGVPQFIKLDRKVLEHAIEAILQNCAKYSASETVRVEIRRRSSFVEVELANDAGGSSEFEAATSPTKRWLEAQLDRFGAQVTMQVREGLFITKLRLPVDERS